MYNKFIRLNRFFMQFHSFYFNVMDIAKHLDCDKGEEIIPKGSLGVISSRTTI